MAQNSLFAILLRQRWWISASIALAIGLVGMALLPPDWRVAGALSGFPFAVIAAMAAWRGRHTPSADQVAQVEAAVRALPWPAFAELLARAFERDGHVVKRINNNTGADFELLRKGQTLLVGARRWKSASTGVEPLRELQAAREAAGAAALCIGLGKISEPAAAFASEHRIAIWGAVELAETLRHLPLPPAKA